MWHHWIFWQYVAGIYAKEPYHFLPKNVSYEKCEKLAYDKLNEQCTKIKIKEISVFMDSLLWSRCKEPIKGFWSQIPTGNNSFIG